MAKKGKLSIAKKVAIVGIPLIIIQLGYVVLFSTNDTATVQQSIDKAIKNVKGVDDRRKSMLKIQLAVADFTSKNSGKPPESLDALRPTYFDSIPVDPMTGKPFNYKVDKNRPYVGFDIAGEMGTLVARNKDREPISDSSDPLLSPDDVEKVSFVYDPSGKRDPFRPFDLGPKLTDLEGKTPLERYDYGQLKLTAVLAGFDEPQAIVENSNGKGFTVKKGTKIGTAGGVVVEIERDRVLILETTVDFTGEKKNRTVELKLRTKDQEELRNRR